MYRDSKFAIIAHYHFKHVIVSTNKGNSRVHNSIANDKNKYNIKGSSVHFMPIKILEYMV